ncbi:MAG TPA: SgcJ/EcaC family oxidoreductase [Chthoniobacterales bacterium]|nr:SgcJ/EcaC family oxidoreductase [Chthoniobacterales bacterium]
MNTKRFIFLLAIFAITAVCRAADTKNVEQAIRDLDDQWSKASEAKDLDKLISFYSDDAIVLPPNAAAVTTKDGIRNVWKEILNTPGATLTWKTTRVEVSKSGDMAYASGTYDFVMKDAGGKSTTERGKYLEVWEKEADGKWKCGADMWSSDAAATPSADKK